jgi:hypothetical protein
MTAGIMAYMLKVGLVDEVGEVFGKRLEGVGKLIGIDG